MAIRHSSSDSTMSIACSMTASLVVKLLSRAS
jgi:hypothetical protein